MTDTLGRSPTTAFICSSLAGAYRATGRHGQVIDQAKQTFADCKRLLGGDHPDTLISRRNLGLSHTSLDGRVDDTPGPCDRLPGDGSG